MFLCRLRYLNLVKNAVIGRRTFYIEKKRDKKLMKKKYYFENFTRDDLQFHLVKHVKNSFDLNLEPPGIALLCYQMGKHDLHEPFVFQQIQRYHDRIVGNNTYRLAFGCLYGALRTDAANENSFNFFLEQFYEFSEKMTYLEATDLIEALSFNTQYANEWKYEFIDSYLKPIILETWERQFRHKKPRLYILYDNFRKLGYNGEELWELLLSALQERKSLINIEKLVHIYETLCELQESGTFYRDLDNEVQYFREKLTSKEDYIWRYSVDQRRYYTYQELREKRNDKSFEGRTIGLESDRSITNLSYNLFLRTLQDAEQIETDDTVQEKDVDKIVLNKFMRMKKGDIDANDIWAIEDDDQEVDNEDEEEDEEEDEVDLTNQKKKKNKQIIITEDMIEKTNDLTLDNFNEETGSDAVVTDELQDLLIKQKQIDRFASEKKGKR